jgi:cytochrome c oxidase subunit II
MGSRLPLFPEQASTYAPRIDAFYFFMVGISAFFALLIAVLVLYFAVRFRRRSEGEVAGGIPHKTGMLLETVWTIIPLGLVMVMFAWSSVLYFEVVQAPDNALEIYVIGKQWMWKLQHREGQREINELHVPAGQPIKFRMTSEDVIHSFFVPAMRAKMDVLPGRYTSVTWTPVKVGKYHLFCAEYCGTKHSGMIGWVYVMEPKDYEAWLSGDTGEGSLAVRGEKLFYELNCNNCHRPDGKGRGPNIENIYGAEVELEGGGTVKVDDEYIRESILNPQAKIVRGYKGIMPTFQGLVTEDQLIQIIEFIKSTIRKPAAAPKDGGKGAPAAPKQ